MYVKQAVRQAVNRPGRHVMTHMWQSMLVKGAKAFYVTMSTKTTLHELLCAQQCQVRPSLRSLQLLACHSRAVGGAHTGVQTNSSTGKTGNQHMSCVGDCSLP